MSKIKILTFDPGLIKAGWANIHYNTKSGELLVAKFGTIQAKKLATKASMRDEVEKFSVRLITLSLLRSLVEDLVTKYNPQYLVCEDAFYNPRMPAAYASLVQWINTVEMLAYKQFHRPMFKVPTRLAKQTIAGNGGVGKENIQRAVLSNDKIKFAQKRQLTELSFHEADAIAVGYHFVINILPGL